MRNVSPPWNGPHEENGDDERYAEKDSNGDTQKCRQISQADGAQVEVRYWIELLMRKAAATMLRSAYVPGHSHQSLANSIDNGLLTS